MVISGPSADKQGDKTMPLKVNLTSEQKLNRIFSVEEFCSVCESEKNCVLLKTPCSYRKFESLIDYSKIDEAHKKLFGF